MTSPDRSAEALIFPIGHYMGAFYPAVGAPLTYHRIRIGDRSVRLDSDDEAAIWMLALGARNVAAGVPWTRAKVEELARRRGLLEPVSVIDEFLEEGILAEVAPGTADAIAFARHHKVQPLMLGMGNTTENPLSFRIGYTDRPAVEVSGTLYELWQWGCLFDLWELCELLADVARDHPTPGEEPGQEPGQGLGQEPEQILTRFLSSLHVLLSHEAVYVDEVDEVPTDA